MFGYDVFDVEDLYIWVVDYGDVIGGFFGEFGVDKRVVLEVWFILVVDMVGICYMGFLDECYGVLEFFGGEGYLDKFCGIFVGVDVDGIVECWEYILGFG